MAPLTPGDVVRRQEYVDGRLWFEHPVTVIQDQDGILAVRLDPGSVFTFPEHPAGPHPWSAHAAWSGPTVLQLQRDGEGYAVWKFYEPDGTFRHWYVNFEEPFRRGEGAYAIHDLGLDLVVTPDGRRAWKDVEDLHHLRMEGRIDLETVGRVLADAARVWDLLDADDRWWQPWDGWTPG